MTRLFFEPHITHTIASQYINNHSIILLYSNIFHLYDTPNNDIKIGCSIYRNILVVNT